MQGSFGVKLGTQAAYSAAAGTLALTPTFTLPFPLLSPSLLPNPLATAVFNFCQRFMVWNSFQAIVMMVQNRYQRRRMYTRIALGKNSAMDVVGGESSGGKGQLLLLYPMLFGECCGRNGVKGCAGMRNMRVVISAVFTFADPSAHGFNPSSPAQLLFFLCLSST